MDDKLLIVGAGGHGRVVADAAEKSGNWSEIAFVDCEYPVMAESGKWPVVGNDAMLECLRADFGAAVIAFGDNAKRLYLQSVVEQLGFQLAVIVHPSAVIGSEVCIGKGTVVFAGAIINYGATLGCSCIVNTASTIDHECVLDDGVNVSPGAHLSGGVKILRESSVGIGASVIEQITIGSNVQIGAGAAVICDIDDNQTVVGVPAKRLHRE